MQQAAILTGVILIGIGLLGYFGQWAEADGSGDQTNSTVASEPTGEGTVDNGAGSIENATKESTKTGPSFTALIPAGFGIILLICGIVAMKEDLRKHAMHIAAGIALLGGIAGLVRGVPGLINVLGGDPDINRRSVIFVWLMAMVCFGFVFMAVNSFISAKKVRESEKQS